MFSTTLRKQVVFICAARSSLSPIFRMGVNYWSEAIVLRKLLFFLNAVLENEAFFLFSVDLGLFVETLSYVLASVVTGNVSCCMSRLSIIRMLLPGYRTLVKRICLVLIRLSCQHRWHIVSNQFLITSFVCVFHVEDLITIIFFFLVVFCFLLFPIFIILNKRNLLLIVLFFTTFNSVTFCATSV